MKNKPLDYFSSKKNYLILLPIFVLALVLRFLYFPQNVYFGFDQARDAYAVAEIINGHFKITGPPTATPVFNHGVLYYYLFTPFYFIWGGDPSAVSAFLRIVNAIGVFLVFVVAYPMFGARIATLAAFLFAISYEQTQFSLFLNHPSLAVISVLFFYLGLSTWIFRKKIWGLLLAAFGLGLSIQFEFVEIQLIPVFVSFLIVFRKYLPKPSFKNISFALLFFLLPVSTYIASEVKNDFITLKQIPRLLFQNPQTVGGLSTLLTIVNRHFQDNLAANSVIALTLGVIFLVVVSKLITKDKFRSQMTFLVLWFFGGLLIYFMTDNDGYFYNTGTSISLLIFTAFIFSKLYSKSKILVFSFLIFILVSNVSLIVKNNPMGPNQKINPQIGLLLKDEKRIVDFIYQKAEGEKFAVNALTMPYNVNTTWSYLFEWYGAKRYGYIPIWGGDAAAGYPGNLKVEIARSRLTDKRFLIIEPLEGIPTYLVDQFIVNEAKYTNIIDKKRIGTMEVWVQQPK
ncbi:hypothetical protein HYS96_04635 [Candidatus Daviesbacteria bacterium]|nr:hypothetical protein [Candidatus Daviesbacteria bacterium]